MSELISPFTYAYMLKAMFVSALVGGVLRRFRLEGGQLHADDDRRTVTVLTDDERPVVFYGEGKAEDEPLRRKNNGDKG
jgi:manganese/iron transport system ATP-binding protein